MSERILTAYAQTSDNFLAHRLFRQKIFTTLSKEEYVTVSGIYLDLFTHFAISEAFVAKMIDNYVKAGLMEYNDEKKQTVRRL